MTRHFTRSSDHGVRTLVLATALGCTTVVSGTCRAQDQPRSSVPSFPLAQNAKGPEKKPAPEKKEGPKSTFDQEEQKDDWKVERAKGGTFRWDEKGNGTGCLIAHPARDGNVMFWVAPKKFEGDLSACYGQQLLFDVFQFDGGDKQFKGDDVKLLSGDFLLVHALGKNPQARRWETMRVSMREGEWHIGTRDGPPPSKEKFLEVLRKVTALKIRGEYRVGNESTGLDNVRLIFGPPTITAQPKSQDVKAGEAVELSVAAVGGGLRYQWSKDGKLLHEGEKFQGVTTASLTIRNASKDEVGRYSVAVSSDYGTMPSAMASVRLKN